MAKQTREDWAKRIERWKDSGLTAKEFAAETGVNAHSLSWWQWKLGAEARSGATSQGAAVTDSGSDSDGPAIASPPPRGRRRRRRLPRLDAAAMTFVEVPTPRASDLLEVVLAGERRIRVPVGFDAPTFERLLALLERSA